MFPKTIVITFFTALLVVAASVATAYSFSTLGYSEGSGDQNNFSSPSFLMSTCTVTTASDSGAGSLRQCLQSTTPGDTINFDSQVFPPAMPMTITLSFPLPSIVTDSLTIDASNAGIVLDGSLLSAADGLVIDGADGVTIQGLQVVNFPNNGIKLTGGASNALIGGDRQIGAAPLGQGNLISHNSEAGIWLEGTEGTETTANQVLGTSIGTNINGNVPFGNEIGVVITDSAQGNVVGGDSAGTRNIISGNNHHGILIAGSGTNSNQVRGNYIGIDVTGLMKLSNESDGIVIQDGAQNNIVGGSTFEARNIISGNDHGVIIEGEGTTNNVLSGNYIGTDFTGTSALSNRLTGILIKSGSQDNVVGGDTEGARNVISGNEHNGIRIADDGTNGNQVRGNYIGIDVTGAIKLSNEWDGIVIQNGAQNNVVGGESENARNIISGNSRGVMIEHEGTTNNHLRGNYIGTNESGMSALGNMWEGIIIREGAQNNVVGGETEGTRNVISGNSHGILIRDEGTNGNQVYNNYIGTNATGTSALANRWKGVVILGSAQNNVVGGETNAQRNIISGNTQHGIQIAGDGTNSNEVRGNYIGIDVTGAITLSNGWDGIVIHNGAQNNIVGGESLIGT